VNAVNFSHDGAFLATAGADNAARIWQLAGDELLEHALLQGHSSVVWDAVFSPDDTLLATISFDGTVKLWDVATGAEIQTLPGTANSGREVVFSPDGKFLAATSSSGLVPIFVLPLEDLLDLAQSRVTRTLTNEECRQYLHRSCPP
jgi:WD40 repeat protein